MMMRTMRTIQAALLICALGSMLASAGTGNLLETWFGQKPAATKPRPTLVATKVRSADQKEPGIVRGMTPTKGRIDLSAIHAATDGEKSSKAVRPSSLREKLMNSMASEGLAPNPLHMDLKKIPKGPLLDFLDTDDDDTDSSNNYDDDDDSDDDEEDDDDSRGSTTKKKSKDKRKKKVKEKGKKKNKPAIWGSHSDTGGDETDDFDNDSDDDVRGRTSSSSGSESDDDDDTKADILVPREKYACTKTNNSPDDDARERLFEDIDFETVKKKKKTMTNADSEVGKKSKSGKAAKAGKTSAGKSAKASKVAKDDSEENEDEFEDEFEDDNADDNDNDNDNDDDEEEEDEEEDEKEEKKEPMEILRASAAVFSKGFKDVLKKTGKVALAAKEAAGEMTKKVSEEAVVLKSNLDRTLMVTDMGRILNLLAQVNHAARFVRLQFSKFTVIITPIIEESLDYLGDEGLDKLKWVDRDDMDLQREALLSLVFGYEFMRFMIIWREYLLLAHEAFRYWMENMKRKHEEYEAQLDSKKEEKGGESKKKAVPPLKRLRFSPASVHNYLLQLAWESMEFDLVEVRENLRFLLAKAKAERRDYENKFLRNLLIMRSYYEPMMEKIDEESSAMRSVTKDQVSTTKLFYKFRNGVANGELNADVFVPEPLTEFMAKMMPQLAYTRKIYNDAHFNNLRKKIEAARKRREALLQPVKERKRKKKPETGRRASEVIRRAADCLGVHWLDHIKLSQYRLRIRLVCFIVQTSVAGKAR